MIILIISLSKKNKDQNPSTNCFLLPSMSFTKQKHVRKCHGFLAWRVLRFIKIKDWDQVGIAPNAIHPLSLTNFFYIFYFLTLTLISFLKARKKINFNIFIFFNIFYLIVKIESYF